MQSDTACHCLERFRLLQDSEAVKFNPLQRVHRDVSLSYATTAGARNQGYMQQPPADKVKILVVEDDPDQRQILRIWLTQSGYTVMTAKDGLEGLSLAQRHVFDIVLTDLKLPGLNGLQLLNLIKDHDPSVVVIFLSGQGTMEDAIAALREGRAYDFIQKPLLNFRQLNLVIEKALMKRQAAQLPPNRLECHPVSSKFEALSVRELELARLLAKGCDTKSIAAQLGLSEKTVRNNLSLLYEKLGVKNRVQAVLTCLKRQLI
ncbi:putative transcriptional regulatory protein NarL [compost metagenome]